MPRTSQRRISAEGWSGRCLEDFVEGDVYQHRLGRTVSATDNAWFTNLTLNTNPLHFDRHYAAQTSFGRPLVNSCYTLALVTGMSVSDVSQNAFANLGWDKVTLPSPVFEGDTLYAESLVLEVRESQTRPDVGLVRIKTTGRNQEGTTVIEFERAILVYKRAHLPRVERHPSNRAAGLSK